MNNGGKNIKQAAILGVLFLALVIVGIMQFRGSANPVTTPAPVVNNPAPGETPATNADIAAPAGEELTETIAGALSWVKEKRLSGMSEEAKMRNPFQSFIDKPTASDHAQVATSNVDTPALAPAPVNNRLIIPDKNLGRMPVYGKDITPLPVAPLQVIPPFKLVSINSDVTAKVNYALVELNGDYYTLRVGEKVPNVDWAVKSIDPIYKKIVLTKKNSEPVELRISGGNDK